MQGDFHGYTFDTFRLCGQSSLSMRFWPCNAVICPVGELARGVWQREATGPRAGGEELCVLVGAAGEAQPPLRSPITTHVLDTSVGRPAAGVAVSLARRCPGSGQAWAETASGVTNRDGRVGDLLPPSDSVEPGLYRRACWQDSITCACSAGAHSPLEHAAIERLRKYVILTMQFVDVKKGLLSHPVSFPKHASAGF